MQCSTKSSPKRARGNSRKIVSPQTGTHPQLERVIARLRRGGFRKPIADFSKSAYEELRVRLQSHSGPLIFDSGCGTVESSLLLAKRNPESLVVGIDKSAARLSRVRNQHSNCLLLRANAVDIWLLAVEDELRLSKHYLLYPNPWPKPKHLRRRWYAHPGFHSLLDLGGELVVRANWYPYVADFSTVLSEFVDQQSIVVQPIVPEQPMSPFERKYLASNHSLYELRYGNTV